MPAKRHPIENNIALILKCTREERALSKNKLAEMAGLNQRAITYIETGRSSPSINTLISVTQALDISLSALIKAAELGKTTPL